MTNTNTINKIFLDSALALTEVSMATLLFIDGKAVSKQNYYITNDVLNTKNEATSDVILYQQTNSGNYYEYGIALKENNTALPAIDKFGNTRIDMTNKTVMVFVNGYKLLPSEYVVNKTNLTIKYKYPNVDYSTVIVYVSNEITYQGQTIQQSTWNASVNTLQISDYSYSRYIFFKNGELIPNTKISVSNGTVSLNVEISQYDIVEFYRFEQATSCFVFEGNPGYYSYGPIDLYNSRISSLYDTIAQFENVVRLVIDNPRPGFFIKEVNGTGCIMIVDDDFEKQTVKCITISKFSGTNYTADNYFIQVPDARSILHYVSQFDLNGTLFPELLSSFQKLLLNEVYDSLQRLKNIRNIRNVDSSNINMLIKFLGLNLNLTNMTLARKHALLEELSNFYRVVGTRPSYNFYNAMNLNAHILDIQQLFTPIEDTDVEGADPIQRYVTFRTPEELGAVYHREYQIPKTDYGYVTEIANPTDVLSNTPNNPGILERPGEPVILHPVRYVNVIDENGVSVVKEVPVELNTFTTEPIPGPNVATIDYGYVSDSEVEHAFDYGYVSDAIKGKWIEWYEWDRPKNWYPTNHVDVSVEVPPAVDYETFMTEFKNAFYDIASAVVYIHSIIEVYNFGGDGTGSAGSGASGMSFNMTAVPTYHTIEYCFTNDPNRQAR